MKFKFILIYFTFLINFNSNVNAVNCPITCQCNWIYASLNVQCANKNLTNLPKFLDLPIEILNLSHNQLTKFPNELSVIETLSVLDLDSNQISYIESDALKGFKSLIKLILSNNKIKNWNNINPRKLLLPAISLQILILSGNEFDNLQSDNILISRSLIELDLSDCKITKFSGQYFFKGLTNLHNFILSNNPINYLMGEWNSDTIQLLIMSDCDLTKIQLETFSKLYNLVVLDLSRNSGLSFVQRIIDEEALSLDTVKKLDLSYCNMDKINLISFPNLSTLILKGNMIRELNNETFKDNVHIEFLDISWNSISIINHGTFFDLDKLNYLDLSHNVLPRIEGNTFQYNRQLLRINLSRNFLSRFNKIIALSLIALNMSYCEITKIDVNSLDGMPHIREIDLSNNIITELPIGFSSSTLENLNVSMSRLSTITNDTFRFFPKLTSLDLSGNRFTTPFKVDYFLNNLYLQDIWLRDNPWRCECEDTSFFMFYNYLTQNPPKLNDRLFVKCESPSYMRGRIWQTACYYVWYPRQTITTTEKIWTIIMITIIVFSSFLCTATLIRRLMDNMKKRRNTRQLQRNTAEQEAIAQNNQIWLRQEAQLNAPDPRENNPPCYEDAILMPKLARQFKSMDEIRQNKRKFPRSSTSIDMNNELALDSMKFCSDEMISARSTERTCDINTNRRITKNYRRTHTKGQFHSNENHFTASYIKAQNLESAEKLASYHSLKESPYTRRKPKQFNNNNNTNADECTNSASTSFSRVNYIPRQELADLKKSSSILHSFSSSIEYSPYTQRKPQVTLYDYEHISLDSSHDGNNFELLNTSQSNDKTFQMVNDHFASKSSLNSSNKNDVEIIDSDDNNADSDDERFELTSLHNSSRSLSNQNKNDSISVVHRFV